MGDKNTDLRNEFYKINEQYTAIAGELEKQFSCDDFTRVVTKSMKKRESKGRRKPQTAGENTNTEKEGEATEDKGKGEEATEDKGKSEGEKSTEDEVREKLETLNSLVKKAKQLIDILQNSSEEQTAQLDDCKQRLLKGNLIVSSKKTDDKETLILDDETLASKGITLEHHIIELIDSKYNVKIPVSDVQACHRLTSKDTVLLKIWNRRSDSAFWKLSDSLKSGGVKKKMNIYVNYQLTKERNLLVFNVRKLKEEKLIDKYFVNENGQVYIKVSSDGRKLKISQVITESKKFMHNPSKQEICDIIDKEKKKNQAPK